MRNHIPFVQKVGENMEKYYTVKEVAAHLGIGVRTVWRELKEGRLKKTKLGDLKATRISESDLAQYIRPADNHPA